MNVQRRTRHFSMLTVLLLSLSACINITTRLPPEDTTVQALREAEDCVPIIFGLAYGTISAETASLDYFSPTATPQKIAKVRRVELRDWQFLFFGERCIRVIGE